MLLSAWYASESAEFPLRANMRATVKQTVLVCAGPSAARGRPKRHVE